VSMKRGKKKKTTYNNWAFEVRKAARVELKKRQKGEKRPRTKVGEKKEKEENER